MKPFYSIFRKVFCFGILLQFVVCSCCFAQIDSDWYNRPIMKSSIGSGGIVNVHQLKNKELIIDGSLQGTYLFKSSNDSLLTDASPFLAKYDSLHNLLALKKFNYSNGTGDFVKTFVDSANNYYAWLYYPSGDWKFDSLSATIYTYTNSDNVFISYDSNYNHVNHIAFNNASCYMLGFDKHENPIVEHIDNSNDSIHIQIYSPNFLQLKKEVVFQYIINGNAYFTLKSFEQNADGNYVMSGGFQGTGNFDLDPTVTTYPITFSSGLNEPQEIITVFDSSMHVLHSVLFHKNATCYAYLYGDVIYVTGFYTGQQLLVPGNNLSLLPSFANNFISCFDKDLNMKWVRVMYSPLLQSNIYPIWRGSNVSGAAPAVFRIEGPISNSTFNLDLTKLMGIPIIQIDSNANTELLGSINFSDGTTLIRNQLEDNTLIGYNQFTGQTIDISYNEIPEIKSNTNYPNDYGLHFTVYKFSPIKKHLIEGKLIGDINHDLIYDSTDYTIPFRVVMNRADSSYTLSDISGNFSIKADTGLYDITAAYISNYFTCTPSNYISSIPDSIPADTGKNFFFIPENPFPDLTAQINAPANSRVQNPLTIYLSVNNNGTIPTSAHCKFSCDKTTWGFISSTYASTIFNSDSLTWDFPVVNPFQTITIELVIQPDSIASLGDSLLYYFNVSPTPNIDNSYSDNYTSALTYFVNSFDPNYKQSNKSEYIDISTVDSSFEFNYTIHFQNTGNDTAYKVILIDTLDANLDLLTLRDFKSSHDFTSQLLYNKILKITFDNIMLPDSAANFAASNGFFSYKIKPKKPIVLQENILNRASIFFDYNEPVLTNYTSTQFVNNVGIKEISSSANFILFPNPANDFVILEIDNKNLQYQFYISDQIGKRISPLSNLKSNSNKISVSNLKSGMYFITLISSDGNNLTKKFVKY